MYIYICLYTGEGAENMTSAKQNKKSDKQNISSEVSLPPIPKNTGVKEPAEKKPKVILKCTKVGKKLGLKKVLNDCSITVNKGEAVVILAPEGNGKTTLAKIICGLIHPGKGVVTIRDKVAGNGTNAMVSYLPEIPFVRYEGSVSELLTQYSRFFKDFSYKRAFKLLKHFKISPKTKFDNLSTTAVQIVETIVVSCRKASLYVFDDPLVHTDPKYRDAIIRIMSGCKKHGAVIILTQVAAGLDELLDKAVFMRNGEIYISADKKSFEEKYGNSVSSLYKEVYRRA